MNNLTIALLQISHHRFDQDANLAAGEAACRQAKTDEADIALFPEMWNIGYTPYDVSVFDPAFDASKKEDNPKQAEWVARAIPTDGPFVAHFQALAKELDMAIALTYLQEWPGLPRNAMSLIDRHGKIIYTYAKVHTCDFSLEASCTPGEAFFVEELDTAAGPVNIGAMICYDREFPESARVLMLGGAEIILVPNACDMNTLRTDQLKSRAYENMLGIALANYPGCGGHSVAFDAVAFADDEQEQDMQLVRAGKEEEIVMAQFDLDRIRDYRKHECWGDTYRKPKTYNILLEPNAADPFVRKDARR